MVGKTAFLHYSVRGFIFHLDSWNSIRQSLVKQNQSHSDVSMMANSSLPWHTVTLLTARNLVTSASGSSESISQPTKMKWIWESEEGKNKYQQYSNSWRSNTLTSFFFAFQFFLTEKFAGKQKCLSVTTGNAFCKIPVSLILKQYPGKMKLSEISVSYSLKNLCLHRCSIVDWFSKSVK